VDGTCSDLYRNSIIFRIQCYETSDRRIPDELSIGKDLERSGPTLGIIMAFVWRK
jgi:hypothetical protein